MKIAVLLVMCAMATTVAASTENVPIKPGIYYFGSSVHHIDPTSGKYKIVSSGDWSGTQAASFFNRRLFAIHGGYLYEVFKDTWRTIVYGFSGAKFFIRHGAHMYTVLEKRLNRVTITGNKATKSIFGPLSLGDPLTMVSTNGYLYCTVNGRWMAIDPIEGDGEILAGRGNPTAAVAYNSAIYAINREGNIDIVNPGDGATSYTYNFHGLFKGSRAIVEYKNMFYAIGKDDKFYEINPRTGTATAKGKPRWKNHNPMAAASW